MRRYKDRASSHLLKELSGQLYTVASTRQLDVNESKNRSHRARAMQGFIESAHDFHVSIFRFFKGGLYVLRNEQVILDNKNGGELNVAHRFSSSHMRYSEPSQPR